MNKKILQILQQIENRLLQDGIRSFKVGKSSNVDERFLDEDYDGYDYASVIATSNDCEEISKLEADLIQYFCNHPTLKEKCQNQNGGSAGNPNATSVYIVAKGNSEVDDEDNVHLNHLMEKSCLFNLEVVKL